MIIFKHWDTLFGWATSLKSPLGGFECSEKQVNLMKFN